MFDYPITLPDSLAVNGKATVRIPDTYKSSCPECSLYLMQIAKLKDEKKALESKLKNKLSVNNNFNCNLHLGE